MLSSLTRSSRKSLSRTAVELMRRGLEAQAAPSGAAAAARGGTRLSATTGLPLVRLRRTLTSADVRALDDEA